MSETDSDDFSDSNPFPTETLTFKGTEPVVSISVDPSGSRFVRATPSSLAFYDFNSLTPNTLHSFKSIVTISTSHIQFGPPSALLEISSTARILSRDGDLLTEFVKGDMYLRDLHNTKGHVSEITTGTWHPTDKTRCVTGGTDSTLRIWDVNSNRGQKEVIVHKSSAPGGRSRFTAVAWGSLLVGASLDGSISLWGSDGPYSRPTAEVKSAHTENTWTSGLDISADGRLVVSRGGDDTIKMWDTRKFKTPIATTSHTSTAEKYPSSNIRFSPGSSNVITGSDSGSLHILGLSLRPELVTVLTSGSPVISVEWHDKLNQIFNGSANGELNLRYDTEKSSKGALSVILRAPKRRHIDDDPSITTDISQGFSGDNIVNPNGLLTNSGKSATSFAARHPTVGLTASGKSRDPRRPNYPAQTPFAKSQPDEKHIKEHIPLSSMRDEDPREALLRYADVAKEDPMFTNAWKETQPKTLYADVSDEEQESGPQSKKPRR